LMDDVILVDPDAGRIERLLRRGSEHNTLLVTERCDQLCVMCSQPPKKSHDDRFALLEQACLLAEHGSLIGISGGEPTLFKPQLLTMLDAVLSSRPDLNFHILSNGQHFSADDIGCLSEEHFRRVAWGIPLYASSSSLHDRIVAKAGAFERLLESFDYLLQSAARIELRTVLMRDNLGQLPDLARYVSINLPFVEQWSIMGLEHVGFAKSRWESLYVDVRHDFEPFEVALDQAHLRGIQAKVFNIPLCHLPAEFRHFAVASISDWKRRYAPRCDDCRVKSDCSGFFEWHPEKLIADVTPL
jgi:His-Xaa-Ser system radical SAM maturase HxsC